jgi:glutathione S-transferase
MAALADIVISTARLIAPKRHGLATFPYVTALLAGVDIEWDSAAAAEWTAEHVGTVYEHFPVFEKDGLLVAQPFAIVRYLAFLGEMQGLTPGAYAQSEMLTEETAEVYASFEAEKEKFLNEKLGEWFGRIEKLLVEDFFTGSQPVQTDAVVWAFLYLVGRFDGVALGETLEGKSGLKAWHGRMAGLDAIANAKGFLDSIPQ